MLSLSASFSCHRPWRVIGCVLAAGLGVTLARADAELPPYEPHPVEIPRNACYVQPDGSIYIVGVDGMKGAFAKWNDLFVKTHPGFKFKMALYGSSTGIGGLTARVSAFAPMGRGAWSGDVSGFKEAFGYKPFDVRIGFDGYGPRPKYKTPPGVYVNAKCPLGGLTMEQLTRIFTSGSPKGDITHWSELGVKGEEGKRVIHVYGPPDDGAFATNVRLTLLGKFPFTRGYEAFGSNTATAKALARDPDAIALLSYFDPAKETGIKLVPLADKPGAPYSEPTYENVHAGRYPLSDALHVYVNRAPSKPMDPFVKEYLRMMLSREGQAIIAEEKDTEEGYVPLTAEAAAKELAKLE